MKNTLIKYYACGMLKYLSDTDSEEKIKKIGRDLGGSVVLLYDFKPDSDIRSLLFRITFELFPLLYHSERSIQKSNKEKNVYYLTELNPLFANYSSKNENFCFESLIAGMIEQILEFSKFFCKVTAYPILKNEKSYKITYEIELINSYEL